MTDSSGLGMLTEPTELIWVILLYRIERHLISFSSDKVIEIRLKCNIRNVKKKKFIMIQNDEIRGIKQVNRCYTRDAPREMHKGTEDINILLMIAQDLGTPCNFPSRARRRRADCHE